MAKHTAFVAYPSKPSEIGKCIDAVLRRLTGKLELNPWPQNDIAGRPLVAPIFEGLSNNDFLIADITSLNFNVTYEIGYAIGIAKRAYLIRHSGIEEDLDLVKRVGIFDTLGYETYRDSDELFKKLSHPIDVTPLEINPSLDARSPLYILETPIRTEGMGHIISRVKKARLMYRAFTPSENSRLSAIEAIQHVANSYGVLIPLLADNIKDSQIHNMRAAFVAGLAHGMQKVTLILQSGADPIPLDIRDFVKSWTHTKEIDAYIEEMARDVVEALQSSDQLELPPSGLLASVSIGDPMAENEFQTLGSYYVQTDQFQRTLRGEVNLVVGRKGTGKTALFSQVRNRLRRDKQNIVVDLKPEGYQLVRFKEDVLNYLEKGAKSHLITAFWEYLLCLEICYKLLEKDRQVHLRNHNLTEPYRELHAAYYRESAETEGDFSERLQELGNRIATAYSSGKSDGKNQRLRSGEVTNLIYQHDLAILRDKLSSYLLHKKGVWILFDNIDKGWSPHGLSPDDVLIVRGLIDAGRKLQREFRREDHDIHCVIFLRNDVYQLLMDESADFGKEMQASLDWHDPDMLRELLRLRLSANEEIPDDVRFETVWNQICISHLDGSESAQYLIDRSLMRPRYLLKIVAHCKGSAVNLRNEKISADDIVKGLTGYSNDLLVDIDQELTDIDPKAAELIYVFRNEGPSVSPEELDMLLKIGDISDDDVDRIKEFLLYYGFVGVKGGSQDVKFIHNVGYDMKMIKALIRKHAGSLSYEINPAFWPALAIES
jgi:hypothetical protein